MRTPRDDPRDARCLARLAGGDRDALAELYDVHAAALYRHGVSLTRRPAEAEDLVQAVFLKLASTGAALLAVRRPAPYMHRMLHAAWIDTTRRSSASREAPLEDGYEPASAGRDRDGVIDLDRALAALPEVQREVVQLHLIEGFSFREAGHITGVSLFTVASRYRLAIERLRAQMGG